MEANLPAARNLSEKDAVIKKEAVAVATATTAVAAVRNKKDSAAAIIAKVAVLSKIT